MHDIELFVALLVVSALGLVAARRLRVPYTLALLLLGVGLGALGLTPAVPLTSRVILLLFLPPLLFEAAFALDLDLLWSTRRGVLALALPGVLVAASVTGGAVHYLAGLPWSLALLFGVMVAATDPVSVLSTFRQLKVDPRLAVLVEGESLFNDGVALALFVAMSSAVVGSFSLAPAIGGLLLGVFGGAAVGAFIGALGVLTIRLVDEHLTEMAVSLAVAYGGFLAAEQLHASGIIAVIAAGMVLGRLGRARGLSADSASRLDGLWEFLAFLANAALFLLLGLTARVAGLTTQPEYVAWGIFAALAGRAAVAYGFGAALGVVRFRLTWSERHILFWGGLRGAVALAAALSLPADFPARDLLVAMVYGVVLFTLLAQGLTIAPLLRLLTSRDSAEPTGSDRQSVTRHTS